jgi:hypothetical protein
MQIALSSLGLRLHSRIAKSRAKRGNSSSIKSADASITNFDARANIHAPPSPTIPDPLHCRAAPVVQLPIFMENNSLMPTPCRCQSPFRYTPFAPFASTPPPSPSIPEIDNRSLVRRGRELPDHLPISSLFFFSSRAIKVTNWICVTSDAAPRGEGARIAKITRIIWRDRRIKSALMIGAIIRFPPMIIANETDVGESLAR